MDVTSAKLAVENSMGFLLVQKMHMDSTGLRWGFLMLTMNGSVLFEGCEY
jgi:hypothetical protein